MARRKSVSLVRETGIDARYQSGVVQKFINIVMDSGKKNVARIIVYGALDILKEKSGSSEGALSLFEKAIEGISPAIEVRPRRVGGSVYQVPTEVSPRRAHALAMRWLIKAAAVRGDKNMGTRIANEILEASEGRGNAVKKKIDAHKMAEANRAFSHFSW